MNIFLVGGAGLTAGAMNALAGGGSFVSLPAMIAAGVPSVRANASSTVALLLGGAVGLMMLAIRGLVRAATLTITIAFFRRAYF